jgi:hypothetical protein
MSSPVINQQRCHYETTGIYPYLALAGVAPLPYHHGGNFLERQGDYIFASRDRINEVRDRQRAISETSALNTFAVGTPIPPVGTVGLPRQP